MSPDSVFWLGRAWYTLLAISVKVRESLVRIPGDCTYFLFFSLCSASSSSRKMAIIANSTSENFAILEMTDFMLYGVTTDICE